MYKTIIKITIHFIAFCERNIYSILHKIKRKYIIIRYNILYEKRTNLKEDLVFGKNFKIFFDNSTSKVKIGQGVIFRDYISIRSENHSNIEIGDHVFFNNFCSISCLEEIIIGSNCSFGEGVKFYDANHLYNDPNLLISNQGCSTGKIRIGENCWFGSNVIILKNVEIGDHVVVGSGCTIYKSVPSNSIVINNQNQIIKPI